MGDYESSLCRVRPTFAATSEWPHREKSLPRVFFESLATRTTRVHPSAELVSRGGGTSTKRSKVSPIIGFFNREFVVRDVGGVNLTRTMTSDKRAQRLVKQHCVIGIGTQSPGFI